MDIWDTIKADAQRYGPGRGGVLVEYLRNPGFKYLVWTRLCAGLRQRKSLLPLFLGGVVIHRRIGVRLGIHFPWQTEIGAGFYVGHGHVGGIVVAKDAVLGKNCNISHGVTIGAKEGGRHPGAPRIGDRVYIGPGAKIIGGVTVGSDAAVGANAVVTSDVPPNAVVGGIPARVISYRGSSEYIRHAFESAPEA